MLWWCVLIFRSYFTASLFRYLKTGPFNVPICCYLYLTSISSTVLLTPDLVKDYNLNPWAMQRQLRALGTFGSCKEMVPKVSDNIKRCVFFWNECGLVGGNLSLWMKALRSLLCSSHECTMIKFTFCCLQNKM